MQSSSSDMKIGLIGAGKMASAIGGGLVRSGKYQKNNIMASDKSGQCREQFSLLSGISQVTSDNLLVVNSSDIVMLCVKPQQIPQVCLEISSACASKLVISIAAGIKLSTLTELLNSQRVIRVMPNTPMMIGLGASAFSIASGCNEDDRQLCEEIFSKLGVVHQVDEIHMDAVTAISGSGPAYVFQFIQALVDAGVKQGLPQEVALALVTQTVKGAAEMLAQKQGTPQELTNAVTSPNGTTYAALQVMEKLNFKSIIDQFVTAATNRSIELGSENSKR